MIAAWWGVWVLCALSVTANWMLLRQVRVRDHLLRRLRCNCGDSWLMVYTACAQVEGWHHSTTRCHPGHEEIHP